MPGQNIHKAVVLSVIRVDLTDTIMNVLEEKYATILNILCKERGMAARSLGIVLSPPVSGVAGLVQTEQKKENTEE